MDGFDTRVYPRWKLYVWKVFDLRINSREKSRGFREKKKKVYRAWLNNMLVILLNGSEMCEMRNGQHRFHD